MWIERTPEEIKQWEKKAESEASSHGWLIAGTVWLLVSICLASGVSIFYGSGTIIATQTNVTGIFWFRFLLYGLLAAPFAYWVFRRERKKEHIKIKQRTVCPQCDTSASGNAGATCRCGGSFVLTSTVKWIEK